MIDFVSHQLTEHSLYVSAVALTLGSRMVISLMSLGTRSRARAGTRKLVWRLWSGLESVPE